MNANKKSRGLLALNRRQPLRPQGLPHLIAHRGFRGMAPENTLEAFKNCVGRCFMIEFDVRLSLDNEAVVFHDDELARCSNAALVGPALGLNKLRVDEWRLCQLRCLDLGAWFWQTNGSAPARANATRLPTLAETLAWARSRQMPLNIELKDQGSASRNIFLARLAIHHIVAARCAELTLFSSFSESLLQECLTRAPFISRALLYGGKPPQNLGARLEALAAAACHPEHAHIDAELVRFLHEKNIAVNAWTVNEPARQRELAGFGIDGLITDFPVQHTKKR